MSALLSSSAWSWLVSVIPYAISHESASPPDIELPFLSPIGGSRRFNQQGSQRFEDDVHQGWLGVVREIAVSPAAKNSAGPGSTCFGRRPEAPWKSLRDTATILNLPSTAAGASNAKDGTEIWTLAKAMRLAFDGENPDEYKKMLEQLGDIDEKAINVKETLRRRVECWK